MTQSLKPFFELPESYVVLDTETTGLPDQEGPPGIVTLGLAIVKAKAIVESVEFKLKPYRHIKEEAEKVHRITNQEASSFPSFQREWPKIKPLIDHRLVVIHNASFDWPIIEFHAKYYNLEPPSEAEIFCSQKSAIDFAIENNIPMSSRGPSLDSLTTYLGIKPLRKDGVHGAEIDCRQTALVVEGLRALAQG